jgi:hypothetical protein
MVIKCTKRIKNKPNGLKIIKWALNILNGFNIYQMATKVTNTPNGKYMANCQKIYVQTFSILRLSKTYPHWDFLYKNEKCTIWQSCTVEENRVFIRLFSQHSAAVQQRPSSPPPEN